jgi:branched-chain amino acid transport system substrate-binding protein
MKKRNVFLSFTIIILISLCLTLFFSCEKKEGKVVREETKNEGIVKIGAILPLTGNLSVFGDWVKKGIKLAVKEKKDSNVEIVYEDNTGQTSRSVSAFHKLSSVDKVKAVITAQTQVANALLPLANSKKLLTIFTFSDLPEGKKDYVLNYHFPVVDEINVLAKFAFEKIGKKGAIFVINDEFGNLSANIFNKAFIDFGGEITSKEHFSFSEKDFRSIISRITKFEPSFLFIIAYTDTYVGLTKALKEMKVAIPIIGPNVLTVYLSMVKYYLPTSYFTSSTYAVESFTDNDYLEFFKKYVEFYNEEPNSVNAEAYEATRILLRALEKDRMNPNSFFDNLKDYKGIFGKIIIDENRQAHFPLVIIKYSQNATKKEVVWNFLPKESPENK